MFMALPLLLTVCNEYKTLLALDTLRTIIVVMFLGEFHEILEYHISFVELRRNEERVLRVLLTLISSINSHFSSRAAQGVGT